MNNYSELESNLEEMMNELVQNKTITLKSFYPKFEKTFTELGFRGQQSLGGIENILLVKLDNAGDFVLASAAIREVRKNFPFAHITLAVNKIIFPLAELCPYVNEVLAFDMPRNVTDIAEFLRRLGVFCKDHLWKRHFSLALDLRYFTHAKIQHIFMSYFSGARERKGFPLNMEQLYLDSDFKNKKNLSHYLYTQLCLNPKKIVQDCARNLSMLTAFGMKVEDTSLEVWYDENDKYEAEKLLKNFAPGKMKIIAGIGASGNVRKYPVEKFLIAFKNIVEKDAALILLGGPSEIKDAKFLQENLPAESVLNLVGVSGGFRVDAAISSMADMYVGNDTGMVAVVSAVHLPTVYVSRVAKDRRKNFPDIPTECEIYAPWQTKYIAVQPKHQLGDCAKSSFFAGCNSPQSHCIAQIEPEEIVSAFDKMKNYLQSEIKEIKTTSVIKNSTQVKKILSQAE